MFTDLLCVIPANSKPADVAELLKKHPEIKFVSLVGIDLAGNDTDEKIPMRIFLDDMEEFYAGSAVQTDGSSVVLTGIATLNNAKVDMPIDPTVNWYVDYNFEHLDAETGYPTGTLRIPAFLIHDGKRVDSRAILTDSLKYVRENLLQLFSRVDSIAGLAIDPKEIVDVTFTSATELEFWVKTPLGDAEIQEMSASQVMQEQYWQRTRGVVRTALEQCVLALDAYGLSAEMGHKEVGGMKAHIDGSGHMTHVCEQLEIDWKYADTVQAADNELLARILVKEIFRMNGLEVNFKAKPMIGLAGNGKHMHFSIQGILKSGKVVPLFAPSLMHEDFLSAIGYGAIMGLLKNYEVVNPLVSATNDSLNRLKPGFEAPICIVTSLGHEPEVPSRNRTILAGLIRDLDNPFATRFELRSPNPYTDTYLVLAAIYLTVFDGIKAVLESGKTTAELLAELSKKPGEEGFYLETDRAYRSEEDVFEDYTDEERDAMFGAPPATVWENMQGFAKYPEKKAVLAASGAMTNAIMDAFVAGSLIRWETELLNRLIPENLSIVRECKPIHGSDANDQDLALWRRVQTLREYLAKDSVEEKSLFTLIREAFAQGDKDTASGLQVEMYNKMEELKVAYKVYTDNII